MGKMTKEVVIDFLSKYFKNYYDVTEYEISAEVSPVMRCDLHVANQKYFMFKSAVIWTANCHEYLYVFKVNHLTSDLYRKLEEYVYNNGIELVNPGKEHMYTYLSLFVVSDTADYEALKLLKKSNRRKDFKFSFHGWMELHTASYVCESEELNTNRTGREYKKLLRDISKYCKQ